MNKEKYQLDLANLCYDKLRNAMDNHNILRLSIYTTYYNKLDDVPFTNINLVDNIITSFRRISKKQ